MKYVPYIQMLHEITEMGTTHTYQKATGICIATISCDNAVLLY